MADVSRVPGLREQLGLILRLRWRLFRNGLRSRSARLGLVGSFIIGLFYGAFALGIGGGLGFGSFVLTRKHEAGYFGAMLWGISLFWQLFPGFAMQLGVGFDSRSLLRFPLRLSSYCLLNVAQGFADPIALCAVFWHLCLWMGVCWARPDASWSVAITLALSVAVNVLFGQLVVAWTERLLAQRRTREIALALFLLAMICMQFVRFAIRAAGPVADFLERTSIVWETLPPGQAGVALQSAVGDIGHAMIISWGALAAYAASCAALLVRRLRAEYLGEFFGDTEGPRKAPRALVTPVSSSAWTRTGWLGGPVAAVFMKELRYLSRNSILAINLFTPLIVVGAISVNHHGMGRHGMSGRWMYTAAMAYAVPLLLMQFSMNSLGRDGGGVQLLYLAPVPFRTIMLGKNLFQCVVLAAEAVLGWVLMSLLGGPPQPVVLAITVTGLVFLTLVGLSVGNWLSLRFPYRMEFGMRTQRPSGMPALIFLLTNVGCLAVLGGIASAGMWLVGPWVVPVAFAVLGICAMIFYRASLDSSTTRAIERQEMIIGLVVR